MDDITSLLFGLDSFRVVDVVRVADRVVQVVIETVARQGVCPDCGAESTRVKDRPLARVRDLPVADQRVALWWRKRRLLCLQPSCPRRSFTQVTAEVPPRSRLTARLRERLAEAIAGAEGLRLCGVMAVAPLGAEPGPAFARLAEVSAQLVDAHPGATVVSAGMSGDLEEAVKHGATHVRIGTSVLGSRPPVQ